MKIIATNKSASFEYFIEERYEAGIVLEGSEIKSLRAGNVYERQLLFRPRQRRFGEKYAYRRLR